MKAEELMDAIGLLPADLIAAADRCRTNPGPKTARWRRWIWLAACFAVLLGAALAIPMSRLTNKNAKSEAASQMSMEIAADVPGAVNGTIEPEEACPREDGAAVDAAPEEGITHPMVLTISWGEECITVTSGNFTVEQQNSDGSTEVTTACGPHPMAAKLEPILVAAEEVTLSWPEMPDAVSVLCWAEESAEPRELAPENGTMILKGRDSVYEITATWKNSCTASYAVRLTCLE